MTPEFSANKFISALVKNLQAVCHGNFDFDDNVKVVGHLYLTVDSCNEFNYILNEKVTKSDKSLTTFVSKSFYAIDHQQMKASKEIKDNSLISSDSRKEVPENLFVDLTENDSYGMHSPQNRCSSKKRPNYSQNHSVNSKQRKILQSSLGMPSTSVNSELPVTLVRAGAERKNVDNRNPRLDFEDNQNGLQGNTNLNKVQCKRELDFSSDVNVTPTENAQHNIRVPSVHNSDIDLTQLKQEVDAETGDNFYTSDEANEDGDESFFTRLRGQTEIFYPQNESTLNNYPASKSLFSGMEDNTSTIQAEKNNVCTECGTAFARKWDLRRHIEVVHLKIKFRCSYCDLTYSRRDHLIKHKKKVHPGCPL